MTKKSSNGKSASPNGDGTPKTVGAYSYELQQKEDEKINPIDLQRAVHKGNDSEDSFENQVRLAVERGCELYDGDFYIVVLIKKERTMHNVVRQYFMPRQSCPRPEYDQIVYAYHRLVHDLEFIWVIPDKTSCEVLPLHKHLLPDDQQDLLKFIIQFNNGELDKLSDDLNEKKEKNICV
jgi:hypothetical protein